MIALTSCATQPSVEIEDQAADDGYRCQDIPSFVIPRTMARTFPAASGGWQREFRQRMQPVAPFLGMLQALAGVHHFVRDLEGRYMAVSSGILARMGIAREDEIVGRTSAECFPPQVAEKFRAGDEEIALTGHPLVSVIELWPSARGGFDWWLAQKFPLRDIDGEMIGIIGTLQSLDEVRGARLVGTPLGRAVEFIRRHHRGGISVCEIARVAGLAARHLNDDFRETFGMSTQEFLTHARIQSACEALASSDRSIAEIAEACGFSNPGFFATAVKRSIGESPLAYRRRFASRHFFGAQPRRIRE